MVHFCQWWDVQCASRSAEDGIGADGMSFTGGEIAEAGGGMSLDVDVPVFFSCFCPTVLN